MGINEVFDNEIFSFCKSVFNIYLIKAQKSQSPLQEPLLFSYLEVASFCWVVSGYNKSTKKLPNVFQISKNVF